jgi:thiol:disulfide interchange protein
MVQKNYVIAIIIIVLFAVLAAVSFGIWRLVHMVRGGWSVTSGSSSSSRSTDLAD